MNDPGLDGPIERDAKTVEDQTSSPSGADGSDNDDADDEQAYLNPSRWWFASTAFPLLAGTFGPMASAFNVCAIASHWRTSIVPPETESLGGNDIPDPEWLLAINGISLAIAIVSNLSLLFNMARRIPFSIAQPITIIGWYMSGFILVGLVASVRSPSLQLPASTPGVVLTQAYYYACLAAGLYIIVASFMVVTVYGAYRGHYDKDFQLTMSQRTLMLQTIAYLVYLLAGGAVFAKIEGWEFLNGVWWANFTLLTIGIGDFSPQTVTGQGLLFPFAIGGIVILGLVVGSIRSLVLERGEKKIGARIVEKKREKVVDEMHEKRDASPIRVRVGLFKHYRVRKPHANQGEFQRRAEEFRLMRKIQEYADGRKKWTSLIISILSWLSLWFVGAAVFYAAEQNVQSEVTYFEWLYFAYTSLLTIGYGDYTIEGNLGKPIFVFWSLLAIPTLTILISNMGDTVIKGVRDLTLWFGEFTILPGEGSTKDRLVNGAKIIKEGNIKEHLKSKKLNLGNDNTAAEIPGGVFLAEKRRHKGGEQPKPSQQPVLAATERLGKEYEAEELNAATQAHQKGDKLNADVHLYHYLLVREIRNVMKDINEEPPKKYSYNEWAWFMRLLGEDENNSKFHTRPEAGDDKARDAIGKADENEASQSQQMTDKNGEMGSNEKSPGWSWVGINSPLLGTHDEAEWVLERLSEKLEEELKGQSERQREGKEEPKPPVTHGSRKEEQTPPDQEDDAK